MLIHPRQLLEAMSQEDLRFEFDQAMARIKILEISYNQRELPMRLLLCLDQKEFTTAQLVTYTKLIAEVHDAMN